MRCPGGIAASQGSAIRAANHQVGDGRSSHRGLLPDQRATAAPAAWSRPSSRAQPGHHEDQRQKADYRQETARLLPGVVR